MGIHPLDISIRTKSLECIRFALYAGQSSLDDQLLKKPRNMVQSKFWWHTVWVAPLLPIREDYIYPFALLDVIISSSWTEKVLYSLHVRTSNIVLHATPVTASKRKQKSKHQFLDRQYTSVLFVSKLDHNSSIIKCTHCKRIYSLIAELPHLVSTLGNPHWHLPQKVESWEPIPSVRDPHFSVGIDTLATTSDHIPNETWPTWVLMWYVALYVSTVMMFTCQVC